MAAVLKNAAENWHAHQKPHSHDTRNRSREPFQERQKCVHMMMELCKLFQEH